MKRLRSIRIALALWYAGTLFLITAVAGVFVYYRVRTDLHTQYEHFLQTYSEDLDANLLEHPAHSTEALEALRGEVAVFRPAAVEYRVLDERGRAVFSTDGWSGVSGALQFEPDSTISLGGKPFKARTTFVEVGPGLIWKTQTGISLERLHATLAKVSRGFAMVAVTVIALSLAGGLWLARKALRPMVQMSQAARRISSENLAQRVPDRGVGDELDELAGAINQMLDRLEESFDRIERFSIDLAHELRTPITRLIGETERALVTSGSEGDLRDLLARHAEAYRSMNSMINGILQLLRSGVGSHAESMSTLSVGELFDGMAESFGTLAEEKGIQLDYLVDSP